MIEKYDKIYKDTECFKEMWDGKIGMEYKIPKYIRIFTNKFRHKRSMNVLELGAGNGEVSELLRGLEFIKEYTATELSKEGVRRLSKRDLKLR